MPYHLGNFSVWRLSEWEGPTIPLKDMLTGVTDEQLEAHRDWLQPHFLRPDNVMLIGTQSFIVRTPQHTILIDACVGNDKPRASEHYNRLQTPFLENMAKLGFSPADFDRVIITHFHIDHVGWCTRLVDGQWMPTFPNARYIFVQDEWDYWKNLPTDDPDSQQCIRDSVMPIVAAGKADLVPADVRIADGVWLEALPGHTPGHVGVHLRSGDQELIIIGDLMHHPIQVAEPQVGIPAFDFDFQQAMQTRQAFLQRYAGLPVWIAGIHFPSPAIGRLVYEGQQLRFDVLTGHDG